MQRGCWVNVIYTVDLCYWPLLVAGDLPTPHPASVHHKAGTRPALDVMS